MPTPNAIDASNKFKQQLAKNEAQSAERMVLIYGRIYQDLIGQANKLANDIASSEESNRGKLMKLARVEQLINQVREQVKKFGGTVQSEIQVVQSQSIQQGINDALKLMELSLPNLPPEAQRQVIASFTRLHSDAIERAAGLLGSDSPLKERLEDAYGDYVANQVEEHLLTGIAQGQNPREIARRLERNLQEGLGKGLTSILTTIRTAQIKSYQLANHATYLANNNIVKGWVWHSALDNQTCLSCISMHGTIHELEETLDDHHNGRCAPIPQTISYRDLGIDIDEPTSPIESGEDWFNNQPASVQREMMGSSMFSAWQDDKFQFQDLSTKYNDEVYGELLRQASLKDLLGEQAKDYYSQ